MAELIATLPFGDLLPLSAPGCSVVAADPGPVWSIAPFKGQAGAVGDALRQSHDLHFPDRGNTAASSKGRILWFGLGQALLLGPRPDLGDLAAVTAQEDGFAAAVVSGARAEAVLARLVPLDLRLGAFPGGRTARTLVGHMTASVTRTGAETFEIMVMRSMARTLVHELDRAMTGVAARDRQRG